MSECNEKMISKVLESTRRKLLETGTRNRLIHVNRANQRANCLNVINEHSDDIYSILRVQSKRMRFKAMGKDKLADGEEMQLALAAPELLEGSDRLTDNLIETLLGPDALAHRLLRLATDAKTAEEEQGLNILYLAFGFLRWRETPASELMREAPLILLPVQLVRNERTSSYDIHTRDDDITTNLPLQERLRQDFGITLPDVEETDEWSPSDYFIQVSEAVSEQASWSVDVDGMQLGFFSFAKLLMHRDLDPMNWPEGAFINNPLLKGLLIEGFPEGQSLFGPDDKLDDILDPAEIIQVIDADASQTKVIEEVRYGESLVVQGPPGTGKSQTITNIIAAAAHDGQTVLFVAEKMAALSVVHDRLVKAGLRDICLELHSRSANKKSLAQELGRTLATSAKALPAVTDPTQLRKTRDELNRLTRLLHEPLITTGDTPFSTISEIIGFIGKGAPPPCIPLDGLEQLDRKARDQLLGAINAFTAMLDKAGRPEQHPFRGTRALQLQPTDLSRLEDELNVAIFEIDKLLAEASRISCSMHQSLPHTITEIRTFSTLLKLFANVPAGTLLIIPILFKQIGQVRLIDALETGAAWVIAHEAAANKFITAAWTINMVPLRTAIMRGKNSFLARLFGNYRNASSELAALLLGALPKSPSDRLGLIDELIEVQSYRTKLAEDEGWLKEVLDIEWRGERTQFSFLLKLIKWLNELQKIGTFDSAAHIIEILQTSPDPVKIAMSLDAHSDLCLMQIQSVKERLQLDFVKLNISNEIENSQLTELYTAYKQMAEDTSRYNEWVDLSRTINSLYECGAGAIVDAVTNDKINQTRLVSILYMPVPKHAGRQLARYTQS